MANIKITIIILHYKNWEDTLKCYQSCIDQNFKNYSLYIIDNDEDKDNFENRENYEKHILRPNKNLGYAGGLNFGMRNLIDTTDYFLCLNNDLELNIDTLDSFYNAISNEIDENVGLYSCPLYDYYNRNEIQAIGGNFNQLTGKTSHLKKIEDRSKIEYLVGAVMCINVEYIKKFDYISEDYFLYFEETDYCFQIVKNGWKIKLLENIKIFHKESGSVGKKSLISDYYTTRNVLYFTEKFYKLNILFVLPCIVILNILPKLFRLNFKRLKFASMGIYDYILRKKGKL
jgi:GT2 family glycosyltransferase